MRTLSATLLAAQKATSASPYIRIYINSTDYSSKLLALEHHEEAYRDRATIVLQNEDLALNDVDLLGEQFEIGYGHTTSAGNEYVGDGTSEDGVAPLWVKSQEIVSAPGQLVCVLACEGMWMRLRELRIMTGVTGDAPVYSSVFEATHTVEELIELVMTAMGWTWTAVSNGDGIIDDFKPVFAVNQLPYETGATVLYRLISMTKSYLRAKHNTTFEAVYPQSGDSADETYYSDQAHYFLDYAEQTNLLIPNSVAVFCNQDPSGEWDTTAYPLITGTAEDATEIAKYTEVLQPFIVASITSQTDADNRAAALLARLKAEALAGRLIVKHDHRVELYDKVAVQDKRGTDTYHTFPTDAMTRVTNIIHRYNRSEGEYTLEMNLGEVTSDFGLPEWKAKPVASVPGPPPSAPFTVVQKPPWEVEVYGPPIPPTLEPLRVEPSAELLRSLEIQKSEEAIANLRRILAAPASEFIRKTAESQLKYELEYLEYLKRK